MTARQPRRGAPFLRAVYPLLDPRSESPWESIMRVLHRAAEIPVTPQQELFDQFGRFVARADLLIDGTPRLHEYDGGFQGGAGVIADVDRLLGRPWDPRRLAAWNQLIEHSLYGRAGRARAYQHWRRAQP